MRQSARIYLLFAMLVVLALVAGCAAPAAQPAAPAAEGAAEPAAGAGAADAGTLVFAIAEDSTSLDPARAYETVPTIVHKAIYETLVTFPDDSATTIEPGLAESWTISDDGLSYTFTLREGATFSDSSPVTADDVVFSFNRMKNIVGNPSFLAETIASVEAPDARTVLLTLTEPDPAILAKLVFGAFGVTSRAMVEAQGGTDAEDAATADTAEEWLNNNSAGSGPYVLAGWERGVETVLVRNENYYGEPVAFERIILRNIPEAATQKIQLEAGDIDIAFDLVADQVAELEQNPNVALYQGVSTTLVFLKANNNPEVGGPLSDPLVQKAIRLALDYEGIRALTGSHAVTPASILPVGFLGAYEANLPQRDVEGAQALLAEAGYGDGLSVELSYPDFTYQGTNMGTLAQKIQADLQEAGIDVTLMPGEVQVALEAYRLGTEPFGLWFWLPDYIDSNVYLEFLPGRLVGLRAGWTAEAASEEILGILNAALTETETEARVALFEQMQDYLIESGPYAPVIQPGVQVGLSQEVQGFVYHPHWRVDLALLSKQ